MHNDPVDHVDLWGLEDIVIVSAIDRTDSVNNILYDLLVHDSYKKIIEAAESTNQTVKIISGSEANKDDIENAIKTADPSREIFVAHGGKDGTIADVNGDDFDIIDFGPNVQTVDMVACYGSTVSNNWMTINQNVDFRSYNEGASTEKTTDDKSISFYQANEALDKKIPASILSGNTNTSGEPTPNILDPLMELLGVIEGEKSSPANGDKKND